MTDQQRDEGSEALDSWESLLDGKDEDLDFEKLNKVLEKIQISPKEPSKNLDPFESSSSKGNSKKSAAVDSRFDGYRHLVILSGAASSNTDELMEKLRREFGQHIKLKPIDSSTHVIVFSTVLDARHVVKNAHKYAPWRLYAADDPELGPQHLDFLDERREALKPAKADVRPATNMSVIRSNVARHLNLSVNVSPEQRAQEREQLKRAREMKKAKNAMWE